MNRAVSSPHSLPKPVASPSPRRAALRGDLLDFPGDPGWAKPADVAVDGPCVRWRPDHWLMIENGRILGAEPADRWVPGPDWWRVEHPGRLILPGFIDTHVHMPQLDVIASHGTALLDWLETYTFPAEQRYADAALCADRSALFLDALLSHGTTSAVVFPTVHRASAEALFDAAQRRGMRLISGKVLMDRHAPPGLCDDVVGAQADCQALIERWHGVDRLAYAVTVRFAPTSSPAQLAMAGHLGRAFPGLYMQTHVAENRDEVRWVGALFPEARSYLDVYHRAGLLHERSVLAHGLWLDDVDRRLLADTGAHIAFCPSSNLFLGSGLMDWPALEAAGARVSVASDVGGGTSLSMQRTLADGYKVQALQGHRLSAWKALHAATRGAAESLGLAHEIGSLEAGTLADVVVWDWAQGAVGLHRDGLARDLHERLFAWLTLSDERHQVQTWVAGCPMSSNPFLERNP